MKFTLIRHGETDYNKKKIIQGQLDIPLNNNGVKSAENLKNNLNDSFDSVYSSPLKRALQTAKIISNKLNKKIIIDKRLKERDFGNLTEEKWVDLIDKFGEDFREKDRNQEYDYTPYEGESAKQVEKRIKSFVSDIKKENHNSVLVVTHAGIIRMFSAIYFKKIIKEVPNSGLFEFNIS